MNTNVAIVLVLLGIRYGGPRLLRISFPEEEA